MCGTCGCADPANEVSMTNPETGVKTVLNAALGHGESRSDDHDLSLIPIRRCRRSYQVCTAL